MKRLTSIVTAIAILATILLWANSILSREEKRIDRFEREMGLQRFFLFPENDDDDEDQARDFWNEMRFWEFGLDSSDVFVDPNGRDLGTIYNMFPGPADTSLGR
ncbi:hypothetical protein GF407_20320 [candidate division KSB1 bacterium]|nr:hypothetical protein [candidate division KSB1 bacterium]